MSADIVTALLDVSDLHVRIASRRRVVHAVRGVSFAIARGRTTCIVGESGCGKSMTSLALMGLLPRNAERSGAIALDGARIDGLGERAMADLRGLKMAMIFQEPMTALNPVYPIGHQLEEIYLRHKGGPRSAARERATSLLERVGIAGAAGRLGQYPHQLSGGLRQRILIAMALMCGPALIIADEPTTALDVTIQAQILKLLRQLQADFDLGILLITHDLGVVSRVADCVAVMYAGEFVETGTARDIFKDPVHPYTRGLLAAIPVPGKTARGAPLAAIPGTVPSLTLEIAGCAFRQRCGHAVAACATAPIPLHEESPGRSWRCLRPWLGKSDAAQREVNLP
jgi:peptide/nickel transport system ATP-binding protein